MRFPKCVHECCDRADQCDWREIIDQPMCSRLLSLVSWTGRMFFFCICCKLGISSNLALDSFLEVMRHLACVRPTGWTLPQWNKAFFVVQLDAKTGSMYSSSIRQCTCRMRQRRQPEFWAGFLFEATPPFLWKARSHGRTYVDACASEIVTCFQMVEMDFGLHDSNVHGV